MIIESRWNFERNCLILTVIGKTKYTDIILRDQIFSIMLKRTIYMVEMSEKFGGIIMADESRVPFEKGVITVWFRIIFDSTKSVEDYVKYLGATLGS